MNHGIGTGWDFPKLNPAGDARIMVGLN